MTLTYTKDSQAIGRIATLDGPIGYNFEKNCKLNNQFYLAVDRDDASEEHRVLYEIEKLVKMNVQLPRYSGEGDVSDEH